MVVAEVYIKPQKASQCTFHIVPDTFVSLLYPFYAYIEASYQYLISLLHQRSLVDEFASKSSYFGIINLLCIKKCVKVKL